MKRGLFFILLLSAWCFAGNPEVSYEPFIVELSGILDLQTFPGPPNYESIQNGDDVERHFYLKLDVPVDVIPKGKHPTVVEPEIERNVRIMQLAISGEDDALWARFRKIGRGGHVKITGSLFHRFTGHHHSRVLLEVKTMEVLNPSPK